MYKSTIMAMLRSWLLMDINSGEARYDNDGLVVTLEPQDDEGDSCAITVLTTAYSCCTFCDTVASMNDLLRQAEKQITNVRFINGTSFNNSRGVEFTIEG